MSGPSFKDVPFGVDSNWLVTFVDENTGHFYCHVVNNAATSPFIQWTEKLNDLIHTLVHIDQPSIGQICLAKYSADNAWYRAQILSNCSPLIEVFFIDYGNVELVEPSSLSAVPVSLPLLPWQALECRLSGIEPLTSNRWENEAVELLKELIEDRELTGEAERLERNNVISMKLYVDPEAMKTVGETMIVAGFCKRVSPSSSDAASLSRQSVSSSSRSTSFSDAPISATTTKSLMNQIQLGVNDHIDVCISYSEGPEGFYCQPIEYRERLYELSDELNNVYSSNGKELMPLLSTIVGHYCCAKWEGQWYRAIVCDASDIATEKKMHVKFIDYGNSDTVSVNDVRELSDDFRVLPILGLKCTLDKDCPQNLNDSEEICAKFEELTADKELVCKIVSIDVSNFKCLSVILMDTSAGEPVQSVYDQLMACTAPPKNETILHNGDHNNSEKGLSKNAIDLKVGETISVYVSFSNNPHDFYCQYADTADQLTSLMKKLNEFYSNDKNVVTIAKGEIHPGGICCTKYDLDEMFYRAEVISSSSEGTKVRFFDYGNCEVKQNQDLKVLQKEFCSLTPQSLECSLYGVAPFAATFSDEACDEFEALIFDKELSMTVISVDKQYVVDLLEENKKKELSQVVISKSLADYGFVKVDGQPAVKGVPGRFIFNGSYSPIQLDNGSYVDVVASNVISPSEFYCQLVANGSCIKDMMKGIQELYANGPLLEGISWKKDMLCIALYSDELWYRATIIDIQGKLAVVSYIDFGNTAKTTLDKLQPMHSAWSDVPMQAIHCSLQEPQQSSWDQSTIDKFTELTLAKHLLAVVIKDIGSEYQVDLIDTVTDSHADINIGKMLSTTGTSSTTASVVNGSSKKEQSIQMFLPLSLNIGDKIEVIPFTITEDLELLCHLSDSTKQLQDIEQTLQSSVNESQVTTKSIQQGQACASLFSEDGQWYRAEITNINNDKICVNFVDYGNSEALTHKEIQPLVPKLLKIPKQCLKMHLHDVHLIDLNIQLAHQWMEQNLLETPLKTVVIDVTNLNSASANVYFTDSDVTINDCLYNEFALGYDPEVSEVATTEKKVEMVMKTTVPVKSSVEVPVVDLKFAHKSLGPDSNHKTHCIGVTNSLELLCQLSTECEQLDSLMESIAEKHSDTVGQKATANELKIGNAYVACFSEDGGWYRAEVKEIFEDGVEVLFVDYGNSEKVNFDCIHVIENTMVELPCFCLKLSLQDVHNADLDCSAAQKWLEETYIDAELEVTVVSTDAVSTSVNAYAAGLEITINDCLYNEFALGDGEEIKEVVATEKTDEIVTETSVPVESCLEVSLADLKFVSKSLAAESSHKAHCIGVTNSLELLCQLSTECEQLDSLMGSIAEKHSDTVGQKAIANELKIGNAYVACFSEDGGWYRAEVKEIFEDGIEVLFVDYGNNEKVNFDCIHVIENNMVELPCFCLKLSLQDVHNADLDCSAAQKWLEETYIDVELEVTVVSTDAVSTSVNAYAAGLEITINDCLYNEFALGDGEEIKEVVATEKTDEIVTETSVPVESSLEVSLADLKFVSKSLAAESSHKAHCIGVTNSLELLCQLSTECEQLDSLMGSIAEKHSDTIGQKAIANELKIGNAYVACFSEDGGWYRAEVKEIFEDGVEVLFVDYGNSEKVNFDCIHVIENNMVELPCFCLKLSLQDVHNADLDCSAAQKWLEETYIDVELEVTVVSTDAVSTSVNAYAAGLEITINDCLYNEFALGDGEEIKEVVATEKTDEIVTETSVPVESCLEVSLADLKFVSKSLAAESSHKAHCIGVTNSLELLCQLSTEFEQLDSLMGSIAEKHSDTIGQKAIANELKIGNAYVACFSEDGGWYRAEVKEIFEDGVEVLFVDYGNSEKVNFDCIHVIENNMVELPCFCLKLSLQDVHNADLDCSAAQKWLEETYIDAELEVTVVSTDAVSTSVNAYAAGLEITINDCLYNEFALGDGEEIKEVVATEKTDEIVTETSVPVESSLEVSLADLKFVSKSLAAESSHKAHCIGVTNSLELLCQLSTECEQLDSLMGSIAEKHSDTVGQKANELKIGNAYVACFSEDGGWYRAEVKDIFEDGVEVLFVDYGNSEKVNFDSIHVIENNMIELPCFCMKLNLHDVHNADLDCSAAQKWLEETYIDVELDITVVSTDAASTSVNAYAAGLEITINDCLYNEFVL